MEFDLVIENGWIVDGLSPSIYRGTIGISGDKIAYMRPGISHLQGKTVIDAGEYCVAPGFIDAHSHADHFLLIDPTMKNKLMQGVTTEIGGNCGSSAYPWNGSHKFFLPDMELQFGWNSFAGFLDALEEYGIAINFGSLAGIGSICHGVRKSEAFSLAGANLLAREVEETYFSSLNDLEVGEAKRILEQALEEGAMGLSVGAAEPGSQSWQEIVAELSESVSKANGVLATHLYSEGSEIVEAVSEAISMAAQSDTSLQISHFKTLDSFNWPAQGAALELIDKMYSNGADIAIDCFPYTFCCLPLRALAPPHLSGAERHLGRHAATSANRCAIEDHLKKHFPRADFYRGLVCPHLESEQYRELAGIDVLTAAEVLDCTPESLVLDLMAAEGFDRFVYYECIGRDNMRAAIQMDCAMVASDSLPTGIPSHFRESIIHPRTFATFQEFLSEFVYDNHIMSLPDAIKKITSAPAKKFGLKGRGVIGDGAFADITIFDPENIVPNASIADPCSAPAGIEYVIVNGRVALERGEFKEVYAGKTLRRGA